METVADFEKWIETMSSELGQQVIAVKRLAIAFTEDDIQLIRYEQVARLRILRSRIMAEVESIKQIESTAQMWASKGVLLNGAVAFAVGNLFMATKGRQDAFDIGAQMAREVLGKKAPFGTVFIVIGKEGIPEDVRAISVSRLARESNRSESEIEVGLRHDGHLLVAPEQFDQFSDGVERAVFDGSLSLPISIDRLNRRIL